LEPELETGLSQVFIALDPSTLGPDRDAVADAVLAHVHAGDGDVRAPGERVLETRRISLRDGVPVDPAIWATVTSGGW
jgi:LDH2 family malate/lactate/ureidoglycolate dehydrogenase